MTTIEIGLLGFILYWVCFFIFELEHAAQFRYTLEHQMFDRLTYGKLILWGSLSLIPYVSIGISIMVIVVNLIYGLISFMDSGWFSTPVRKRKGDS